MVLMAIVGGLGSGKTLALTYLAYRNYLKGLKIFSNYELAFPYQKISKTSQLEKMKSGFFAGDELWLWLDSRVSSSKRNRVVGQILLSSRKKDINFVYTTQSFSQVDVRIRRCTDFIAQPMLTPREDLCRLVIFSNPSFQYIKQFRIITRKIFPLFNTKEIVSMLD